MRKNCSSDRLRIFKIFEIIRTFCSNSERLEQFLEQNAFLTCSWGFLRSDILKRLKFKFEIIIGIQKSTGELEKATDCSENMDRLLGPVTQTLSLTKTELAFLHKTS